MESRFASLSKVSGLGSSGRFCKSFGESLDSSGSSISSGRDNETLGVLKAGSSTGVSISMVAFLLIIELNILS